jgi:hypothetical protein
VNGQSAIMNERRESTKLVDGVDRTDFSGLRDREDPRLGEVDVGAARQNPLDFSRRELPAGP